MFSKLVDLVCKGRCGQRRSSSLSRAPRRGRRQPRVEELEPRCLLTGPPLPPIDTPLPFIGVVEGVLWVVGDNSGNEVTIDRPGANTRVTVTNGIGQTFSPPPFADGLFSSIVICSGAGNDRIDIVSAAHRGEIGAGNGNDMVTVRNVTKSWEVDGGGGANTFGAQTPGEQRWTITGKDEGYVEFDSAGTAPGLPVLPAPVNGPGAVPVDPAGTRSNPVAGVATFPGGGPVSVPAELIRIDYKGMQVEVGGPGPDIYRFLVGGSISGTLDGGGGINTLDYHEYSSTDMACPSMGICVNLALGMATAVGDGQTMSLSRIQNAIGGEGDDMLFGDGEANVLAGGPGADVLRGGPGNDVLIGGIGADALYGEENDDILIGGSLQNITFAQLLWVQWRWRGLMTTPDPYQARVDALMTHLMPRVCHDPEVDTLDGGEGWDWFWADEDPQTMGWVCGEYVNDQVPPCSS